jgi:hypothetical protein
MEEKSENDNPIIVTGKTNKLLIIVVAIFVIAIIFEAALLLTKNNGNISEIIGNKQKAGQFKPKIRLPDSRISPYLTMMPSIPLTPANYYYDINNIDKPINELFFNDVKVQFKPGEPSIFETIFPGDFIAIEKKGDNTYIVMKSRLSNGYGKTVYYVIPNSNIPKLEVYDSSSGSDNKISLNDLKPNDIIEIYEKNDYLEDFSNSFIGLKIFKR